MDEEKEQKEIGRGQQAERLLNDDLIKEAFELIYANLFDKWHNSPSLDKDGREDCYRQMKALNEFKRHFEHVLRTGKLASTARETRKKQKK